MNSKRKSSSSPIYTNTTFWDRVTLHGLRDLYLARGYVSRAFWFVAFLGALVAAMYGCGAIVSEYLRSPVVVSYVIEDSERNLSLPDIIICPFNRFDRSKLAIYNISTDLSEYLQLSFGRSLANIYDDIGSSLPNALNTSLRNQMYMLLDRTGLSFSSLIERLSLECEKVISYCIYNGNIDHHCCNTTNYTMNAAGKCFRLSSMLQLAAGYGFGMTVVLNLPVHLYTPSPNMFQNRGVLVKLAESGKGVNTDMTFIPEGTHAMMPLRATHYEFMNDPDRYPCLDVQRQSNYSSLRCFEACLFEVAKAKCNCSPIALNARLNACDTYRLHACLYPETSAEHHRVQKQNNGESLIQKCRSRCIGVCDFWQYSSSVTYATFPSATIRQFLSSDEKFEKLQHSIVLDVFFERLEYTHIRHLHSMTPDTFISNIGGQIGLWVGGSILTLLQLVTFLIQYVCDRIRNTPQKNETHIHMKPSSVKLLQTSSKLNSNSTNWNKRCSNENSMPHHLPSYTLNGRAYCRNAGLRWHNNLIIQKDREPNTGNGLNQNRSTMSPLSTDCGVSSLTLPELETKSNTTKVSLNLSNGDAKFSRSEPYQLGQQKVAIWLARDENRR